jgi:ABC-type sugar transport system ATPase subunit
VTDGIGQTLSSTHLLEIEGLSKHFSGVQALDGVSLSVAAGEVHALIGQNGAGKSTLVKCISGVHPPDRGRVVFDGQIVGTYSPHDAYGRGIAVVHQRSQLVPWLSVAENVLLGQLPTARGIAVDRREANERTRALLARFRLDIDPEVAVVRLTTPEQHLVAIAKALFRRAKLLVLDEPTEGIQRRWMPAGSSSCSLSSTTSSTRAPVFCTCPTTSKRSSSSRTGSPSCVTASSS